MLAGALCWWFARLTELLPAAWTTEPASLRGAIIIETDAIGNVAASIPARAGQRQTVPLPIAARLAHRRPVLMRPPPGAILTKHHTVPATPQRQLQQLLHHELARITPFQPDQIVWRWDPHETSVGRRRTSVILTIVPRIALAQTLAALDSIGLKADALLTGPAERPVLLPIGPRDRFSAGLDWVRVLSGASLGLATAVLAVPVARQAIALHHTENAISDLRQAVAEAASLQRDIAAATARHGLLARESERTGNVLQILATLSRILPDNTFLTDFSVHERQITFSGRSASAPRLVTSLSVDPTIRDVAFAAPVTRIEDAAFDIFSIKARLAKP